MPVSNTRRGVELARALKAECRDHNAPCWLCGQPINYDADPFRDPDAFQADHVVPSSIDMSLQDDPDNLRPSHASCNRARSNNPPEFSLGTPSEAW